MKNIIVPTDFSIKASNALELAKSIAKKTNSTIHLLHIIEPVLGQYSSVGEVLEHKDDDIYTIKLIEKTKEKFEEIKTQNEDPGYTIQTEILVGYPHKEIKKYVERIHGDLILLGSKGYRDAEDVFLGSLTEKVVQSNVAPVITVNDVSQANVLKEIVYATDLEEDHKPLMNLLLRLQDIFDSTLHIVKVNTRRDFKNDIDTKLALKQLVSKYELKNYTLNIYNHEDEEFGIVHFADDKKADLIAMGIHERKGFRRILSGSSLADTVSNHTYRPVLTFCFNH